MSKAAELGCRQGWCSRKAEPTRLRNEASLNCVSLRSELDCEVSCKAVKGQDERRHLSGALDRLTTHQPRATQHDTELARFHGKTDKKGDAMGRPSCQSSLLSHPNANFSLEMSRRSNKKEGRHVGLDFYDLLIEGHYRKFKLHHHPQVPESAP